ncbi:EutP/PduV family microcompartment system protein [Wohlfahrtiimonas populi]|uniref:EutP/PduV family microcompartment system protein n=1 Tax=Wohlfahrtiimonas populi TaxID=1940240 RepID=UPI00098D0CA4|nr:EutP/PduV family microcompartment system protein [Wohlfahrtiimonas populi]
MKKYVFVGSVGVGKTSLFNALMGDYELARKTQAVDYNLMGGIDTPGEFFSHPHLYKAMISTTTEAEIIIYVHSAEDQICRLPRGILDIYNNKTIVTVITKVDLPDVDLPAVRKVLVECGLKEPFLEINTQDPKDVQMVADYLKNLGVEIK